ncbi:transposase [Fulvivirgaceae bacterium BMA10]|uniref:Transposase n=1 Tax=Splendidivirga corallicola TaxID=3051826 RepID=A0ABT8KUZ8_9BACT|nr:transposase [Fulvivirgaceae bacterium BMA10]
MGRKYTISDHSKLYFMTFAVVNWIDVFVRDIYKEKFIESLEYCRDNKGLQIYAYCIMTSHIHLILGVEEGKNLSDVIRDVKSYTSKELRETIADNKQESRRRWMLWMFELAGKRNKRNNRFQFWQQHNHPIELSTNEMMEQRLDYIHNNPVAAGFVNEPENWLWSSANQYAGNKGRLEVLYIE